MKAYTLITGSSSAIDTALTLTLNFKEISIRKNYYQYTTENTIGMKLNI